MYTSRSNFVMRTTIKVQAGTNLDPPSSVVNTRWPKHNQCRLNAWARWAVVRGTRA